MPDLRKRPVTGALLVGVSSLVIVLAVATAAALSGIRGHATRSADDLARTAAAIPDLPEAVTPQIIQAYVAAVPAPTTLLARNGQPIAVTGDPALWQRAEVSRAGALATVASDVRLREDVVEVARALPSGRTVLLRRDLGRGSTAISTTAALVVGGLCLLIAVGVGLGSYLRRRSRVRGLARIAAAAEAVAAGRPLEADLTGIDGDLGRVGAALSGASDRLSHLGDVADRQLSMLSTAIEPLPIAVTGRGPTGGRLRNVAMERLLESLAAEDRTALDEAVSEGLDASGPTGSSLRLRDGRLMEVDAWAVPGGRLVAVAERTEQERLGQLRRQIEGSAIRQLKAPVDEIKARGAELYKQLPASAASTLRSLFAATDRLDRVVRMLLRGTDHDPALRPPRAETFGVAGLLWGLLHDWDAALRQRALRVELDIAPDLPDVRTDPALVEEILTELVDNAAKYTPRGGTVALSVRAVDGVVSIAVSDTGTGFSDEDVPHATQRFFRGRHSESIPGAGLGLGVAAALAERLDGALVVEPGPGGRVRLDLNAVAAAQVAATV